MLPTDAARVWQAVQHPAAFLFVVRGVFGMPALAGRTEPLRAGERGSGWLLFLHVLPTHRHEIHVVDVDEATLTIRTEERGGVLRSWNHTLHVEPIGEARCRYSDTVTIDAGALTPLVARLATVFYRYRHRRWRVLVRRHLLPDRRDDGAQPIGPVRSRS